MTDRRIRKIEVHRWRRYQPAGWPRPALSKSSQTAWASRNRGSIESARQSGTVGAWARRPPVPPHHGFPSANSALPMAGPVSDVQATYHASHWGIGTWTPPGPLQFPPLRPHGPRGSQSIPFTGLLAEDFSLAGMAAGARGLVHPGYGHQSWAGSLWPGLHAHPARRLQQV